MKQLIIALVITSAILTGFAGAAHLTSDNQTLDNSTHYYYKIKINGITYTDNTTQILDNDTIKVWFNVDGKLKTGSNFIMVRTIDNQTSQQSGPARLYHIEGSPEPVMILK